MKLIRGKIDNVYQTDIRQGKDGTSYGGHYIVQIHHDEILDNGMTRSGYLDAKTEYPDIYAPHIGKDVEIPIRTYVQKDKPFEVQTQICEGVKGVNIKIVGGVKASA